jgi:hypothetical protein
VNRQLQKQLDDLSPGDLVVVEWCDASVGKSLGSGVAVDVPVRSWGIFIGVLGEKTKHIVLAQNSFKYSDGLFDIDYTAVPCGFASKAKLIVKSAVESRVATELVNSFIMGGRRITLSKRIFQKRVRNHGRLD